MLNAVRQAVEVGAPCDLGTISVDAARVAAFRAAIGLPPGPRVPLGLALALCGGPQPAVPLVPDIVTVHGGHVLLAARPFLVPGRYQVTAWIRDIFEKSGRSGELVVIARRAELRDATGTLVVTVDQSEIARRRGPERLLSAPSGSRPGPPAHAETATAPLELGECIISERRPAPDAATVARYAASISERVPFFTDAALARAAGFADVIVPGPMQSALLEERVATRLPDWALQELHLTFRVPVITGEPIRFEAVVVEHEDARVVLDLTITNSSGDRAAIGSAVLRR